MPDREFEGVYVNISKTLQAALDAAEAAKAESNKVVRAANITTAIANEAAWALEKKAHLSNLTKEQKRFLGVVAGEALQGNVKEQKAVAHTIMNRLKEPRDRWTDVRTVTDVLDKDQYIAVDGRQYNLIVAYLDNRDGKNADYESLIAAVLPIYAGSEPDFTGGAHFIFNAIGSEKLEADLKAQPDRYIKTGPISGIDDIKFRMYRCLW